MLRKQKQYKEEVLPSLKEKFGYKNDLAVPALAKIVINAGLNAEDSKSGNLLEETVNNISKLVGQKAIIRKSKKSIATFKLREGMPIGVMVTIRKQRMYSFFDRFVSIACPRIRDFQGIKLTGDGHGNFTVGCDQQQIFPELENATGKRGFNITIVTTAKTDEEGKALLEGLGFPVRK